MRLTDRQKYWIGVVAVTVLGLYIGHRLNETTLLIDVRYCLHHFLTVTLNWRAVEPRHTAIVLVGDREYWGDRLAGRRPLKRDYLAELLTAVDGANPAVIALDFDLSAPDPVKTTGPNDYYPGETIKLREAVAGLKNARVVLPQTVAKDVFQRHVLERTVHDDWGFCPLKPSDSPQQANDPRKRVYCGYLILPYDKRLLPPRTVLADGLKVDSFALATARAKGWLPRGDEIVLNYGSFIPRERFEERKLVISADEVTSKAKIRENLAHRVVLIGGDWGTQAFGRGVKVDDHPSPAGVIPGVFVHANYVEAILDGRAYSHLPEAVPIGAEAAIAIAVAYVFERRMRRWCKAVIISGLIASFLVLSYLLLQNLGRFVDALFPLILVTAHAVIEQVRDWRHEALLARSGRHGGTP